MSARIRTGLAALLAATLPVAGSVAAQGQKPEIWRLSAVIKKAVARVAPSVVTVETFGGALHKLGEEKPDIKTADMPPNFKLPSKPGENDEDDKAPKDGKELLKRLRGRGFIQAQGAGTGLIIGSDGWVLTSRFQLNFYPSSIIVTLNDGRKFTAKMHGEDRTRGLVLLKVDAKDLPLPTLAPAGEVRIGQWGFALGRSFGPKSPTVHAGIISAIGRIGGKALQCDAYTSPANYGGPLIDLQGRVLGVITPLSPQGDMAGVNWYDSGIGFATTLDGIDDILAGMKDGRVYKKAFLGITLDQKHLGPGALLTGIRRRTAAYHAQLRKGDNVLEVDGQKVRNGLHLQWLIRSKVAGDFVMLVVKKKKGSKIEVLVELDTVLKQPQRPKPPPTSRPR